MRKISPVIFFAALSCMFLANNRAWSTPTLLLEELDSNTLTATLGETDVFGNFTGNEAFGTVTQMGPDSWLWTIPSTYKAFEDIKDAFYLFAEPGFIVPSPPGPVPSDFLVNRVVPLNQRPDNTFDSYVITSDVLYSETPEAHLPSPGLPIPDGILNEFIFLEQLDGSFIPEALTFHDLGDTVPEPQIPEPQSWVLLATGCLGLVGYGWLRQQHARRKFFSANGFRQSCPVKAASDIGTLSSS